MRDGRRQQGNTGKLLTDRREEKQEGEGELRVFLGKKKKMG